MLYFLDTSALVKRYRFENGTPTIDNIFSDENVEIIICALSISEVASALNKHLRKKEITPEDFRKTVERFYFDLQIQKVSVLDIKEDDFFKANNLIFEYNHTSSDAVILAAALELREFEPIFVCADIRSGLLSAAIANHLSTLNPASI